jgi:ribosomal protein S18 acetylase RimI-like enzyme
MLNINYSINSASYIQIYDHLILCDKSFIPILSERVSIDKYSKKIFDYAIRFEAFSGKKLIGLIAAYECLALREMFITNVSIDIDYVRKNVATVLLFKLIAYSLDNNFKVIRLEVNIDNKKAIFFYNKHNFIHVETNLDILIFKLNL